MKIKQLWKKTWHFIWEEDSIASWTVNVILAFIIVKFIIYPLLGLMLGTSFPVVAVVSSSMEHQERFDEWWQHPANKFYRELGVTEEEFESYKFKNGFNKGDLMVLRGAGDIERGDVIVFRTGEKNPVIHRVVVLHEDDSYQTKGDNHNTNVNSRQDELKITEDRILGKASLRIPLLGWFKIAFVSILQFFGLAAF